MRVAIGLALPLLSTLCLVASGRADDPGRPYRKSPAVLVDPAVFYSPLLYQEMGEPKPGEWKAEHPESRQSFADYTASRPVRPTVGRHTIVLAPVGPMSDEERRRLTVLREFLEAYYTLPVRVGDPLGLTDVTSRDRQMFGRTVRQYLTGDVLYKVLRPALPDDALCLLGVTMEDLYPEASWNYVFGQASLSHRVGVYSLVRFYPQFLGYPDDEAGRRKGLLRSLHTLVHETGHMFGVHHCQKYACVLNGTNSLRESDTRPIHLCPVCLRKLRWALGFEMIERYESLLKYYRRHDMKAEADWLEKRIRQCRGKKVDAATGQVKRETP